MSNNRSISRFFEEASRQLLLVSCFDLRALIVVLIEPAKAFRGNILEILCQFVVLRFITRYVIYVDYDDIEVFENSISYLFLVLLLSLSLSLLLVIGLLVRILIVVCSRLPGVNSLMLSVSHHLLIFLWRRSWHPCL